MGILDACSMGMPHTHPRATEMQISINASIRTGMIPEVIPKSEAQNFVNALRRMAGVS
jgi:hypothetical protein